MHGGRGGAPSAGCFPCWSVRVQVHSLRSRDWSLLWPFFPLRPVHVDTVTAAVRPRVHGVGSRRRDWEHAQGGWRWLRRCNAAATAGINHMRRPIIAAPTTSFLAAPALGELRPALRRRALTPRARSTPPRDAATPAAISVPMRGPDLRARTSWRRAHDNSLNFADAAERRVPEP
jgi:hypothetical protein